MGLTFGCKFTLLFVLAAAALVGFTYQEGLVFVAHRMALLSAGWYVLGLFTGWSTLTWTKE